MKTPHLLRVDDGPERFAPLLSALAGAGLRAGWLELGVAPDPALLDLPSNLAAAVARGALRAVAVRPGASVAVKALRGRPVLKDLLREHFLGCALVLVHGDLVAPELHAEGEGWRVSVPDAAARFYRTDQVVAEMRRPRPWT